MAHRISITELEQIEGYDAIEILEEVMADERHCPAMCSEGCGVEMDGRCPHGFPSLAMYMGWV